MLLSSFALLAVTSLSAVDSRIYGQLDRYQSALSGAPNMGLFRGGGTDSSNDQGGTYDPAYNPDGDGEEEGAPPPDEPPPPPPEEEEK